MGAVYTIMDKTKIAHTILPAAISATTTGETVDTLGYDSVGLLFTVGAVTTADGSNYFVITWEDGDASNMSDAAVFTTWTAIQGTLPAKIEATTGDEVDYTWNYTGHKRYIRAVITETGTAAMSASAHVVLGHPRVAPVS